MEKDRSITVHQRNLQYLITEMYETKNGLNPAFMREIFCQQESQYSLRILTTFLFLELKLLHMAQKPFALQARKFGLPFHNLSKIPRLPPSLKTKSNPGLEKAATTDYAKLLSQT